MVLIPFLWIPVTPGNAPPSGPRFGRGGRYQKGMKIFLRMHKTLYWLLLAFFPLSLSAQDAPVRRNELGLESSRLVVGLLGGSQNPSYLTLTYKRLYGDWALRSSFSYEVHRGESHRLAEVRVDHLRFHHDRHHRHGYTGRVGLEQRRPLVDGVIMALGMDLVYGYSRYDSRIQAFFYQYAEDTLQGVFPVPGLGFVFQQPWEHLTSTTHRMGLDATAALLFPLGARLMLSAKIRTSLHYYLQTDQLELFGPETVTTTRSRELAFTMGPRLISELNLYFRF